MSKDIDDSENKTTGEPSSKAPRNGPLQMVIAAVEQWVIFILLYVFSIGPMYWPWHAAKQGDGYRLIAVFYEPLYFLAGLIPWFGDWLNWYICLWIL